MNKILISFITIIAVSGLVATATYAIFSGQASNQGNTFATGDASLQIKKESGDVWKESFTGSEWKNIYPGWTTSYNFYLKNNSSAPISLKVKPKLEVPQTTNWNLLDKIKMNISWSDGSHDTGFRTMRDWLNAGNNPFIDPVLSQGEESNELKALFMIDPEAGNEIKNSTINFNLIFEGQQVLN
jgi:hypothetical protein